MLDESYQGMGLAEGRPAAKRRKVLRSYERMRGLLAGGSLNGEEACLSGILDNREHRLEQLAGDGHERSVRRVRTRINQCRCATNGKAAARFSGNAFGNIQYRAHTYSKNQASRER